MKCDYGLSSSYAIFYCYFSVFSKKTIRQDMALRKESSLTISSDFFR